MREFTTGLEAAGHPDGRGRALRPLRLAPGSACRGRDRGRAWRVGRTGLNVGAVALRAGESVRSANGREEFPG